MCLLYPTEPGGMTVVMLPWVRCLQSLEQEHYMTGPQLQPKTLVIAEAVAFSPIILAFVIGSIPVLIPALVFRCLVAGAKSC